MPSNEGEPSRAGWPGISRWIRDGYPFVLVAAFLSPSLATITSWNSPSIWIRIPVECSLLCVALFAYRWRYCRALFWLAAAAVPMGLFCRVFYGSSITAGVLASTEYTTAREAWEMARGYPGCAILGAIYFALIGFGAAVAHARPNPFTTGRLLSGLVVCSILLPFGAFMWLRAEPPANYRPKTLAGDLQYVMLNQSFPWDLAYSEYAVLRGQRAVKAEKARRESFVFPGLKRLASDYRPQEKVVLNGESSRRESWSLFGYGRETNPLLTPVVGRGLFLFDRIRSNANITINSLPLVLTGAAPRERQLASEEKSIVGLAEQAGFDTYWISSQEKFGGAANPTTAIAAEADHVLFLEATPRQGGGFHDFIGAYDGDILKPLKDAAAQNQGNGKKVIFIHTMGSHAEYASRVPAGRAVFAAATPPGVASDAGLRARTRVDEYDDSVRYTDSVIKGAIDVLAGLDQPSALLYFSDHGERMYCGAYPRESFGHGFATPAKDELDVPVLLWLSPRYRLQHPRLAAAARANGHFETSLGSVFDTFVDMIRVDLGRTRRSSSLLARSPARATFDVLGVDGLVHADGLPQQVCGWENP